MDSNSKQADAAPPFASVHGYAPRVGDIIAKVGISVRVTMMSHSHVVYMRAGLEYTMQRGEFARLVAGSLARGAKLTRQEHNDKRTDEVSGNDSNV